MSGVPRAHDLASAKYIEVARATDPRPVVVIDPDDREQIDRLCAALSRVEILSEGWDDGPRRRRCAEALREFASPKPAEPTGLGAVVEDASGQRWVRATANTDDDCAWVRAERYQTRGEAWCYESYDMCVPAVRVLSEGVTA